MWGHIGSSNKLDLWSVHEYLLVQAKVSEDQPDND